jgi:ATP-dependent protease HslVU (ClpYQ) ATPase subunit
MYQAPNTKTGKVKITKKMVAQTLQAIVEDEDLSRYIL